MTRGVSLGLIGSLALGSTLASAASEDDTSGGAAAPAVTGLPPEDITTPPSRAATAAPIPPSRAVEVGANLGVASRSSTNDAVRYDAALAYGAFARVDLLSWLGARLSARVEKPTASFAGGALGIAGAHFDDADLTRIYLSAAVEPTWSPIDRLGLFAGVGFGWGRTVCPALRSTDADNVLIPQRAAVFVDFPLSLGARYEIVKDWLVLQASGSVSFPTDQSGTLLKPVRTPGQDQLLTTAAAFPELGTSFTGLLGLGILL